MTTFIITTESGSDLNQNLVERYNIHIIPMHMTMDNTTKPGGSFSVSEVFDYYECTNSLPQTDSSTPDDCGKAFRDILATYPDVHIVYIGYAVVTTVSFNLAKNAAEDSERIHIVDSQNVSFILILLFALLLEPREESF